MKIVITAATSGEWMPAYQDVHAQKTLKKKGIKIIFHQSGVGMLATAVALMQLIVKEKPDCIIQIGIAGTYKKKMRLGTTVVVREEALADMGVEENNKWIDIFDLKLENANHPPFEKKKLPNQWLAQLNVLQLPEVKAITINEITTSTSRIKQYQKKYAPVVESMEGAALHFVCRTMNIPFIQIRSISNYVAERDKSKWRIKESIANLNTTLLLMIDKLYRLK